MIEANASLLLDNVTVTATAKTRVVLALHHLLAADRFANRISEVEREYAGQSFGAFWEEIFQNALGVATLSVASIECHVNDLFFEGSAISPYLNPVATDVVVEALDSGSILQKYRAILGIRMGKKLDMGTPQVQSADDLIKLRNALVHFRPEWFGEQREHDKLSKRLKGKFETSGFLPNEPVFPRAWASHSFVVWALSSTIMFLEHFHKEADIPNPFAKFKGHIKTVSTNVL